MLSQYDLDSLMQTIQADGSVDIYYVVHMIEPREGILDEHIYKSSSKFKVIKVTLTDIYNAFFELLYYLDHTDEYHTEEEDSYYDRFTLYKNLYTVKNSDTIGPFQKDLNPRMPSIVYGYRRKIIDSSTDTEIEINDESIVKPVYTNNMVYGDLIPADISDLYDQGKLDWKYQSVGDAPVEVDGVEFNYVTSPWYILTLSNFPTIEKPLIKTDELNSFFTTLQDAFDYIEQLEA